MIEAAAQQAKWQPWIVAFWATEDIAGMIRETIGSSQDQRGDSDFMVALGDAVDLLLERMGAQPSPCDNPFQAGVYHCARNKKFLRASRCYTQENGGPEAVAKAMNDWAEANRDKLETLPRALPMRAGHKARDGGPPLSLEDLLDKWARIAREEFQAKGKVTPIAVGILPDGSEIFFSMRTFQSASEKRRFHAFVDEQFRQAGVVRSARVVEAWAAKQAPGQEPIRASRASNRQEVVMVSVADGERELSSVSTIERDWQTGKATLGPAEEGESQTLYPTGIGSGEEPDDPDTAGTA